MAADQPQQHQRPSGDLHLTHQWHGSSGLPFNGQPLALPSLEATSKVHYRARGEPLLNHSHRLCTAIAAGTDKDEIPIGQFGPLQAIKGNAPAAGNATTSHFHRLANIDHRHCIETGLKI